MKNSILLLLTALILTSCTADLSEPQTIHDSEQKTYFISKAKAIDIAENFRQENFTLHSRSSQIESIDFITPSYSTRSHNASSGYYIINYKDNSGFAIIASDSRLNEIQAISEDGNISIQDTTSNACLALFFERLNNRCYSAYGYEPSNPRPPLDTTIHIIDIPKRRTEKIAPMIETIPSTWGASAPFNQYCIEESNETFNENFPLESTVVATAQIMSYHKWPKYIDGISLNWESFLESNSESTYRILAKLAGIPYYNTYYNTYYEFDSYGNFNKISTVFEKLGYCKPSFSEYFTEKEAMNRLYNGPLMIQGLESRSNSKTAIIDGLIYSEQEYEDRMNPDIKYTEYSYLFHCVWGNNGRGNGYFRWIDDNIGEDEAPSIGQLKYFYNFSPNK